MTGCQHSINIEVKNQKKSVVRQTRNYFIVVSIIVFFLSGCTSKPSLENEVAINVHNNLAQLTQWKMKGKIAWITPSQRTSAYMNWQQNDASIEFTLTNVLGINMATLSYDGATAKLSADSKNYQGVSPSALILQTTGWQVPINALSTWVKGMPISANQKHKQAYATNDAHITRYDNGLIQQIRPRCTNELSRKSPCNEWTIDYTSYTATTINNIEYQLPTNISMFNAANKATIKMRISEWSQLD